MRKRKIHLTDSRHPKIEPGWRYLYTDLLGSNPVNDEYCKYYTTKREENAEKKRQRRLIHKGDPR